MFDARRLCLAAGALACVFEVTVGIGFSQPQLPSPPAPMPAVLRNYQPVTAERLLVIMLTYQPSLAVSE